jgi:glycosyltransferase involved in cell wall biosynthesis
MTVSYCITLYNKEIYVTETLRAVLAEYRQTGGEIIVYDDCSTDSSLRLVNAFATHAPVRVIAGEPNIGVVLATDRLIREANAPYLKLVDADDVLRPGSTVYLRDALDSLAADMIYGKTVSQAEAALWPTTHDAAAEIFLVPGAFRVFLRLIEFNVSSTLSRTSAAKATLPLPSNVRLAQDLILGLRLARHGRIAATNRLIAVAPDTSVGRLSRQVARMYADFCRIIDGELALGASATDATSAARRNARRCLRYFRRYAPGSLRSYERFWLISQAVAPPWQSIEASRRTLRRIDTLYQRDVGRVLG